MEKRTRRSCEEEERRESVTMRGDGEELWLNTESDKEGGAREVHNNKFDSSQFSFSLCLIIKNIGQIKNKNLLLIHLHSLTLFTKKKKT